jgi:putative transposase
MQMEIVAVDFFDVPRYLLRDRDAIYETWFGRRVENMGIERIVTSPRSPWRNAYVERLIGTIRRECLNHVIVVDDRHLKRILAAYFRYYHDWRTHQALEMDCPEPRAIRAADRGRVVEIPEIGGLHHHYERIAG